jgi:tyrosine phenol-lyase
MSDRQWAGMMLGDEAYAGSRNFYHLEEAVQTYYGYKYLVPTHQGRGAEHLISQSLIKPGDVIPGNMYFTTTRLHQELAGGSFVDVIVDEAHDPASLHPFKGNIDLDKLDAVIARVGRRKDSLRQPGRHSQHGRRPAGEHGQRAGAASTVRPPRHPPLLDATRMAENAFFIQEREEGYADTPIAAILKEFCSYTDGAWMSSKKDHLVNIGGWLAMNHETSTRKLRNLVVVYEGLHTYGGMAGRDMEAVAIGIGESLQDDHMRARIGQVRYLGELLSDWNIPIVQPVGGHAIFLDAKAIYPHIAQDRFPAQTLAAQLYLDSGIRSDGAWRGERRARPGHRRPPLSQAGAGAADDPASRLHPGAHGRSRRVGEGGLR